MMSSAALDDDAAAWLAEAEGREMLPPMGSPEQKSTEELLARFEKTSKSARASIESASDELLQREWTLLAAGNKILYAPGFRLLRNFVLYPPHPPPRPADHYMRLNEIPLPGLC